MPDGKLIEFVLDGVTENWSVPKIANWLEQKLVKVT